jgi:cysteinyl-tRNA synthetase
LSDFLGRLKTVSRAGEHAAVQQRVADARRDFDQALATDLNTSAGFGAMFDLVRAVNTSIDAGEVGTGDVATITAAFDHFDNVLGVVSLRRSEDERPPVPVDEIEQLIGARKAARSRRDFAEADRIRKDLADRGVLLEDSAQGTRWKRA